MQKAQLLRPGGLGRDCDRGWEVELLQPLPPCLAGGISKALAQLGAGLPPPLN